jgi:hypothetical protein
MVEERNESLAAHPHPALVGADALMRRADPVKIEDKLTLHLQ